MMFFNVIFKISRRKTIFTLTTKYLEITILKELQKPFVLQQTLIRCFKTPGLTFHDNWISTNLKKKYNSSDPILFGISLMDPKTKISLNRKTSRSVN